MAASSPRTPSGEQQQLAAVAASGPGAGQAASCCPQLLSLPPLRVCCHHCCRHPLDHKPKQDFKLAPGKGIEPPALMVKLDEAYRWVWGGRDRRQQLEQLEQQQRGARQLALQLMPSCAAHPAGALPAPPPATRRSCGWRPWTCRTTCRTTATCWALTCWASRCALRVFV